ncbi:MAG: zinc-dependent metalloprotease [Aureispira sp.]
MVRCLLYTMVGLFLSIGVFHTSVQAQSAHNHAACGVGLHDGEAIKTRMLNNRRNRVELLSKFENSRSTSNIVYVPVQFHIVNRNDGTGGETIRDIFDNLCRLNNDYAPIGVEFYLAGPIRTVNQDLLYTNSFASQMANYFMGLYRVDGVVNVFVGDRITSGVSGGTTLGYYTPGIDVIYAIRSSVNANATTLTHEMGHFLGLPHTFVGWEGSFYGTVMSNTTGRTPSARGGRFVENIARPNDGTGLDNCQLAADAFCDTDPNYLFGFYGATYNDGPNRCNYAATAIDPNGWLFRPDLLATAPDRFKMLEDESAYEEFWLRNLSTKDQIYSRTLVIVEAEYTFNGTTVTMWSDTLGDTTSREVFCPTNNTRNIIGRNSGTTDKGIINMAGHKLDVNITAPSATGLIFDAASAEYTITSASGQHRVDMDSLRVTNTGLTTVAAGETIVVTDVFSNGSGVQISSDNRNYNLPNALAPGESYTFTAADLQFNGTEIAGISFSMKSYAPYQTVTGTTSTSNNVMSYYGDVCATDFSVEQSEAMKMDIASRGFSTLYDDPTDVSITQPTTLNYPTDGSIAPQPLVNFRWDAVPGATMYHVEICEINILGACLLNGERFDFMTTTNDTWKTLAPNKRYRWTVMPVNSISFCDRMTLQSTTATFQVFDWTIGVDKVEGEATTTRLYPNPTNKSQQVVLEINATKDTEAQISMINSIGQTVMPAQTINVAQGVNVERLSTANLTAGLYIVNVETEGTIISHKLVIQE